MLSTSSTGANNYGGTHIDCSEVRLPKDDGMDPPNWLLERSLTQPRPMGSQQSLRLAQEWRDAHRYVSAIRLPRLDGSVPVNNWLFMRFLKSRSSGSHCQGSKLERHT
jgi:hypothetical protein